MTAPPREPGTVRVCPVRDRECREPEICDQRKTGCQMLIELPPELDHLRAPAPSADKSGALICAECDQPLVASECVCTRCASEWHLTAIEPPAAQPAEPLGIKVVIDPAIPAGEVRFVQNGRVVGRIVDAAPAQSADPVAQLVAEQRPLDPDVAKVLRDNFQSLIARDDQPAAQPAEPPAQDATDDLVRRLNDALRPLVIYESTDGTTTRKVLADDALRLQRLARDAAAALPQRQAREIAELKSERDAAIGSVNVLKTKYGECVDERDALRECVKAADAMRRGEDCPMCDSGELRNPAKLHWDSCAFANYDAARAKVKMP